MNLPEHADTRPAGAVDRNDRLKPDLEITPNIDRTWINGAGGRGGIAEIVRDWGKQLRFNDRDQMIDEVGELKVFHLGFEIGHAVL